MPVIRLMAVPEDELESDENLGDGLSKFSCPWFQNSERSGDDEKEVESVERERRH